MRRTAASLPLLCLFLATSLAAGTALAQDEEPPPEEPGPGAPPAPGDAEKDGEDSVQQPPAQRDADAPAADAQPKGSDTTPSSSVLITFQGDVPRIDDAVTPQEDLGKKEFVTFSGTARCKGCDGALVLMVEHKADDPGEKRSRIVTVKPLAEAGDFEILLPEMDDAVILHLLVDENGSGKPDRGERTAMLELGGKLIPNQDRSKLVLDATAQD